MTAYNKGAIYEREFIHILLRQGAVCAMRGAGSKSYGAGRIDVHAIWNGSIWYFQLKNWKTKIPKKHLETLYTLHNSILGSGVRMDNIKICFGKRSGGKWELYTFPELNLMVIE